MSAPVSAGRFVFVDGHLSVRLPHQQAHVVENVTLEEANALLQWARGLHHALCERKRQDYRRRLRGDHG